MYICICIYMYICIFTCIYIYKYIYTYTTTRRATHYGPQSQKIGTANRAQSYKFNKGQVNSGVVRKTFLKSMPSHG